MYELYVHPDHVRVGFCKSVLEEAGIPCFIRNENTNNTMTGMPSPLFFPALCVLNDDDIERSRELLNAFLNTPPSSDPDWTCPSPACAEPGIPGSFDSCWKCGTLKHAADG
jgi:hypothetical protein